MTAGMELETVLCPLRSQGSASIAQLCSCLWWLQIHQLQSTRPAPFFQPLALEFPANGPLRPHGAQTKLGTYWRWARSWHIAAKDKCGQLSRYLTVIVGPAVGHGRLLHKGTAYITKISLPSSSVKRPHFLILIHLLQISKIIQRLQCSAM